MYSLSHHSHGTLMHWLGSVKDERKLVKLSTERSKISHTKKWEGPRSSPVVKNSPCNAGDVGLIPDLGRTTRSRATKDMHHNCWACALELTSTEPTYCDHKPKHPRAQARMLSHVSHAELFVTPPRLEPARLLSPWDSPGKSARVDFHAHLQGIFPTHGSNLSLLPYRWILYCWATREAP